MTKLTNEELRKLLRQYAAASYAYTVAERDSDDESKAEAKSDELETEILQRMAEGAAGEASPRLCGKEDHPDKPHVCDEPLAVTERSTSGSASPQGDLLAALKGMVAVADSEKWHNQSLFSAKALAAAKARNAINNFESGSATTAGPRPRCPKCGSRVCDPYKSTETGMWTQRCIACEWFDSWAGFAAAPAEDTRPKTIIANVNVDAFLAAIGIDTSKGNGLGLEWEPRYIATKAFELCEPCANSAPEDVQLDVEALWTEFCRTKQDWDRVDDKWLACEQIAKRFAKLALLRRVSGKGAIQAAFEAVLPALKFTGLDVRVDNLADRGWNSAVRETKRSMESYLASPAPVPATPSEPRYTAKEIISLIRSAEWEEEFMQADDESYVAFITGKLAQMTTQGTPEPVDSELTRWIGKFADKWDDLLGPRIQQIQDGAVATYEDLRLALKMMLEVHGRDKCTEEGCGCYGSMATNIFRAADASAAQFNREAPPTASQKGEEGKS